MASEGARQLPVRTKGSTPLGSATFVILRGVDVWVTYNIHWNGWGKKLIEAVGGTALESLNPWYKTILVGMSAAAALKHIWWLGFVSETEMPLLQALEICASNNAFGWIPSVLSIWTVTALASSNPGLTSNAGLLELFKSSPTLAAGAFTFALGIATESISEIQRKRFKADPSNKGKPYGGGLFSVATHINYGGYTLWRVGMGLANAGLPLASAMGAFFSWAFIWMSIPQLDSYCQKRYGEAWSEIKRRTRRRLLPFYY